MPRQFTTAPQRAALRWAQTQGAQPHPDDADDSGGAVDWSAAQLAEIPLYARDMLWYVQTLDFARDDPTRRHPAAWRPGAAALLALVDAGYTSSTDQWWQPRDLDSDQLSAMLRAIREFLGGVEQARAQGVLVSPAFRAVAILIFGQQQARQLWHDTPLPPDDQSPAPVDAVVWSVPAVQRAIAPRPRTRRQSPRVRVG